MCCPTSCHPGPSLWHSEHAYRGLPQGKLLPPKHEAMFSPNPRGWGGVKVWMMLTSEFTLIFIYYVNLTWVNRKGFWWRFQQGKIQPMSMCILWDVDKKQAPSYKMASISDFSKVRPDTFSPGYLLIYPPQIATVMKPISFSSKCSPVSHTKSLGESREWNMVFQGNIRYRLKAS